MNRPSHITDEFVLASAEEMIREDMLVDKNEVIIELENLALQLEFEEWADCDTIVFTVTGSADATVRYTEWEWYPEHSGYRPHRWTEKRREPYEIEFHIDGDMLTYGTPCL